MTPNPEFEAFLNGLMLDHVNGKLTMKEMLQVAWRAGRQHGISGKFIAGAE